MTKKKIKEKKEIAFNCEIEVEKVPERSLFLHEHFASGTYGKYKFDVISILPSHSLVIEVDKQRYLISNQTVIRKVLEKIIDTKENKNFKSK